MKWPAILLAACMALSGCTITVSIPLNPKKKPAPKHGSPASKKRKGGKSTQKKPDLPSSFTRVDADWMRNYKALEEEHGRYTIREDAQIRVVGDDVFVPQRVLEHYEDMLRASAFPSSTPQPQWQY